MTSAVHDNYIFSTKQFFVEINISITNVSLELPIRKNDENERPHSEVVEDSGAIQHLHLFN